MITTQAYNQSHDTDELARALGRWNWGAFLLNWIWGIGNRCYFGWLTFVPFFGLAVPFVLGAKGNAWAWRTGKWQSLVAFQRAQRRWTRIALIAYVGAALGAAAFAFVIMAQLRRSSAFELAYGELSRSPRVAQLLGTPLEAGLVMGSMQAHGGGSGQADLAFALSGPIRKGKVYARASEQVGIWSLQALALVLEDGQRIDLRESAIAAAGDPPPSAEAQADEPPPSAAEPPRLPVMRVHLAGEKTEVRGALALAEVERALDEQRAQLESCLEPVVGPSTLVLKLVVSPKGEVQRASLERSRGVDARTRTCVTRAARGFHFSAPKHGSALIKHTIAIGP